MTLLSFKEACDLAEKQIDRLYSYWNSFTVTSGLITGWFLLNKDKITVTHQLTLTLAFSLFAFFSLNYIIKVKKRLEYLIKEMKIISNRNYCIISQNLTDVINTFERDFRCRTYIIIHLISDIIVLVIIWYFDVTTISLNLANLLPNFFHHCKII